LAILGEEDVPSTIIAPFHSAPDSIASAISTGDKSLLLTVRCPIAAIAVHREGAGQTANWFTEKLEICLVRQPNVHDAGWAGKMWILFL
jgi:hypothetical protein